MNRFLTTKEAAEFLKMSPWVLLFMRQHEDGPPYIRIGKRKIVYDVDDLVSFMHSKRVHPGGSAHSQGGRAA